MRNRMRLTAKSYGGSYEYEDSETPAELEKIKVFLRDKIKDMMKYGLQICDGFPRRARKLADVIREKMLQMHVLSIELEKSYYKKTTLRDLDVSLEALRDLITVASDKDYYRNGVVPPLTLHQREVWARYNTEIGNMIGGYKKALESDRGSGADQQ